MLGHRALLRSHSWPAALALAHTAAAVPNPNPNPDSSCVRVSRQSLLASIRHFQQKLLDNHERSKTVTRSADMQTIRNQMQVCAAFCCCVLLFNFSQPFSTCVCAQSAHSSWLLAERPAGSSGESCLLTVFKVLVSHPVLVFETLLRAARRQRAAAVGSTWRLQGE